MRVSVTSVRSPIALSSSAQTFVAVTSMTPVSCVFVIATTLEP